MGRGFVAGQEVEVVVGSVEGVSNSTGNHLFSEFAAIEFNDGSLIRQAVVDGALINYVEPGTRGVFFFTEANGKNTLVAVKTEGRKIRTADARQWKQWRWTVRKFIAFFGTLSLLPYGIWFGAAPDAIHSGLFYNATLPSMALAIALMAAGFTVTSKFVLGGAALTRVVNVIEAIDKTALSEGQATATGSFMLAA